MAIGGSGIESVLGGRADALAMNPRAQQEAMQKGRQDVRRGEVPGNLLDLLAMQKLADDKQRAKAEMDASIQSNPATIRDQLEQELVRSTKEDVAKQVGGALNQQAAQAQKRMSQIANQPAPAPNLLAGVARAPAPNMARMAGGGIVAFANGGDITLDAVLENIGLTREQYEGLSDKAKSDIQALVSSLPERSAASREMIAPSNLKRILRAEADRSIAGAPGPIGLGMEYLFGDQGSYQAARGAREAATKQAELLRGAAGRSGSAFPALAIQSPDAGIAAAPRAAPYSDPFAGGFPVEAPQAAAATATAPKPEVGIPSYLKEASTMAPGTLEGLQAQGQRIRDISEQQLARDPYEEARKRAALTDKITGRQGIMDLAREGREARAAAVARQKAGTPSLAWTSRLGGIGGLADINRAMSAERAAQNAAELANLDKDLAARQTEALRATELGSESSRSAREGMQAVESARAQASANLAKRYEVDSTAANKELERATTIAVAVYDNDGKKKAAEITAAATRAAKQIQAITDDKDRLLEAEKAIQESMTKARENEAEQIANARNIEGLEGEELEQRIKDIRAATKQHRDNVIARLTAAAGTVKLPIERPSK